MNDMQFSTVDADLTITKAIIMRNLNDSTKDAKNK